MKVEGPDLKEGIQDNFRQWYMEAKRTTGNLPEFPADEEWQKSDFKFSNQAQTPATAAEDTSKDSPKEDAKADKKGKKGDDGNTEEGFRYDDSEFLTNVQSKYVYLKRR